MGKQESSIATVFLASFLLLAASLSNYLVYDRYPLFRTEVMLSFAGLAIVAIILSAIYVRTRFWVQRALDALLLAFVVDINSEGYVWPLVVAAGYVLVSLRLRQAPHKLLAIFGGFVLVSSLLGLGESEAWLTERKPDVASLKKPSNRPAVIHVLLDEHIGIEGFHKTVSGQATAAKLRQFYLSNGFHLYGKAYSQHLHTINAIPQILNFGSKAPQIASRRGVVLGKTEYFDRLQKAGYDLIIYQSAYADFCSGYGDARCISYSNSSLQPLMDYDLTVAAKTTLILAKFIGMSEGAGYMGRQLSFLDQVAARAGFKGFNAFLGLKETGTIPALRVFDRLASDLKDARPGQAYFLHALLPHYPYTTAADCSPKPMSDWKRRKDPIPITERANAYDEQALCAARQIEKLLETLRGSRVADNFVMLVHGDHGSRLTRLDPIYERRGTFRDADLVAGHSTLFAVRVPGEQGAYSGSMVNAARILETLSDNEFSVSPDLLTDSQPYIFIADRDWKPKAKESMPSRW